MKHVLLLQLFLIIIFNSTAQQTALKEKILQLEHKWVDVALKHDAKAFAAMMSDSYVRMNPDGTVGYKQPWVEAIRNSRTTYDYVNLYDTKIQLQGNTAIVTGKFRQKATKSGVPEEFEGSFMNTWQQQKGKWLIISSAFYILKNLLATDSASNISN